MTSTSRKAPMGKKVTPPADLVELHKAVLEKAGEEYRAWRKVSWDEDREFWKVPASQSATEEEGDVAAREVLKDLLAVLDRADAILADRWIEADDHDEFGTPIPPDDRERSGPLSDLRIMERVIQRSIPPDNWDDWRRTELVDPAALGLAKLTSELRQSPLFLVRQEAREVLQKPPASPHARTELVRRWHDQEFVDANSQPVKLTNRLLAHIYLLLGNRPLMNVGDKVADVLGREADQVRKARNKLNPDQELQW